MRNKAKKSEWSERKKEVARALAEGLETQRELAKRFNLKESSISRWKLDPEFIKFVDDITLSLERHTLAGMLRRIDSKQQETTVKKDEWTKLEEMKSKLLGFDKQKVEHSGEVGISLKWNEDKDEDTNNPIQPAPGTKKVS